MKATINAEGIEEVTITRAQYNLLVHRDKFLGALESGGVDNWEWYSESINEHYPECWGED